MKVEPNSIYPSYKETSNAFELQKQFKNFHVLFVAISTYSNLENLDRYSEGLLTDLKDSQAYFKSLPIYENTSDANNVLSYKDKVIAAKTLDILNEFIPHLESYNQNATPIIHHLKKAILAISIVKAFSFYPTSTQADTIYLSQFSSDFSRQFSSLKLSFDLLDFETVKNDPIVFLKQLQSLEKLVPSFNALKPHVPLDSPYKNQLEHTLQNLLNASFRAKMLLNQIHYGNQGALEKDLENVYNAYKHFIEHIELPF